MRCDKRIFAAMAQQVEHVLGKDEVTGSNPVSSSKNDKPRFVVFLFIFTLNQSIIIKQGNPSGLPFVFICIFTFCAL